MPQFDTRRLAGMDGRGLSTAGPAGIGRTGGDRLRPGLSFKGGAGPGAGFAGSFVPLTREMSRLEPPASFSDIGYHQTILHQPPPKESTIPNAEVGALPRS